MLAKLPVAPHLIVIVAVDSKIKAHGGGRGIGILDASVGSGGCRFLVATAINTGNAKPYCPPLPTALLGLAACQGLYGIPGCWRVKPPRGGAREAAGEGHAP